MMSKLKMPTTLALKRREQSRANKFNQHTCPLLRSKLTFSIHPTYLLFLVLLYILTIGASFIEPKRYENNTKAATTPTTTTTTINKDPQQNNHRWSSRAASATAAAAKYPVNELLVFNHKSNNRKNKEEERADVEVENNNKKTLDLSPQATSSIEDVTQQTPNGDADDISMIVMDDSDGAGNGSLILENLVNQFLEKNKVDSKQLNFALFDDNNELNSGNNNNNKTDVFVKVSEELHKQHHQRRHIADVAGALMASQQQLSDNNNNVIFDNETKNNYANYQQAAPSYLYNSPDLYSLNLNQNSLVETSPAEIDDRHIQYDVLPTPPSPPLTITTRQFQSNTQLEEKQQQQPEEERFPAVESVIPFSSENDLKPEKQLSNYKLEPITGSEGEFNNNSLAGSSQQQSAPEVQDSTTTTTTISSNNNSSKNFSSPSQSSSLKVTSLMLNVNNNINNQHQHQNANNDSQLAGLQALKLNAGNIQARSMNSNSHQPQVQLYKQTTYSKAPYATYDAYLQQRNDVQTNLDNITNKEKSSSRSNFNLQSAPSSSSTNNSDLVNSINKISSHLAGDAASPPAPAPSGSFNNNSDSGNNNNNNNNVTTGSKQLTDYDLNDDRQQHLLKLASVNQMVDLNPIVDNNGKASYPNQFDQDQLQHRNNILASFSHNNNNNNNHLDGRYYYPTEQRRQEMFPSLAKSSPINNDHHQHNNDRYTADHEISTANMLGEMDSNVYAEIASKLIDNSSATMLNQKQLAPHYYISPYQVVAEQQQQVVGQPTLRKQQSTIDKDLSGGLNVNRKTIDSLSLQLQNSDSQQQANNLQQTINYNSNNNNNSNSPTGKMSHIYNNNHGQYQLRSGSSLGAGGEQQSAPANQPSHYVASLINVTAPMSMPLSATEAMETALSDGKSLLNQVSGLLRTPSNANNNNNNNNQQQQLMTTTTIKPATAMKQQQLHNYYFLPNAGQSMSASDFQAAVYSQPANQFSPKPFVNNKEDNSMSIAIENNNNTTTISDKERMRLDGSRNPLKKQQSIAPKRPLSDQHHHHQSAFLNGGENYAAATFQLGGAAALNMTHAASGFRSPLNSQASFYPPSSEATTGASSGSIGGFPLRYHLLSGHSGQQQAASSVAPASSSYAQGSGGGGMMANQATTVSTSILNPPANQSAQAHTTRPPPALTTSQLQHIRDTSQAPTTATTTTTNGFITSNIVSSSSLSNNNSSFINPAAHQHQLDLQQQQQQTATSLNKRVFNLTRVEHISAECSNDLIRAVIVFNGTFRGIIYSSGYVQDLSCIYVNGTGSNRYDFSIKLNQCGTLSHQTVHQPKERSNNNNDNSGLSRREHVMWNTLSIQYNPIIEQEWDEHFRVSCEYGSDFWKTVSFSPFNVETNTGSPVVFTVDPPQCQMEILRGHGMVGPRQQAVSGPVTVGDPLTLLIHMKSEKAGYDILVKNCIAHNGGHQKMQLIDANGCVVNERFISPFRGTYNDQDLKHITLYSYLKAFRFTGSPVLYLECEIHMCQSACPPQMCYWRSLSKRSLADANQTSTSDFHDSTTTTTITDFYLDNNNNDFKSINLLDGFESNQNNNYNDNKPATKGLRRQAKSGKQQQSASTATTTTTTAKPTQISDSVSLFQALEVRQERESPDSPAAYSIDLNPFTEGGLSASPAKGFNYYQQRFNANNELATSNESSSLMCYRRVELMAFLITAISIIIVAFSVLIGCCWRVSSIRRKDGKKFDVATAKVAAVLAAAAAAASPSGGLSGAQTTSKNLPSPASSSGGSSCSNSAKLSYPPYCSNSFSNSSLTSSSNKNYFGQDNSRDRIGATPTTAPVSSHRHHQQAASMNNNNGNQLSAHHRVYNVQQ